MGEGYSVEDGEVGFPFGVPSKEDKYECEVWVDSCLLDEAADRIAGEAYSC